MTDDDTRAFRRAMIGVRPLAAVQRAPAAPKPRPGARFSRANREAPLWEERRRPYDAGAPEGGDAVSFRRPAVRPDALRRLGRGDVPVEGEIDLHGLTRQAAHEALRSFLAASIARGLRCVRVVTGKGLGSGASGPVLRPSVIDWLSHLEHVLAFVSARPADGGTGALHVLLKTAPRVGSRGPG